MDDIFTRNPLVHFSNGIVFIGDKLLVYRRDNKTDVYPLWLDFPGGRAEAGETPYETFRRETNEEFGLDIFPNDIVYAKCRPSETKIGKFGMFFVAKLPETAEAKIVFGDEGLNYMLMAPEEFLARDDAVPFLVAHTKDYLVSLA